MAQTLATPLFIDMSQLARCIFFAALVADLGAALSLGLASEHFADGSREMLAGIFVVWVAVLIPMAASSVEILHRLRGRRARPQAAVGRGGRCGYLPGRLDDDAVGVCARPLELPRCAQW